MKLLPHYLGNEKWNHNFVYVETKEYQYLKGSHVLTRNISEEYVESIVAAVYAVQEKSYGNDEQKENAIYNIIHGLVSTIRRGDHLINITNPNEFKKVANSYLVKSHEIWKIINDNLNSRLSFDDLNFIFGNESLNRSSYNLIPDEFIAEVNGAIKYKLEQREDYVRGLASEKDVDLSSFD